MLLNFFSRISPESIISFILSPPEVFWLSFLRTLFSALSFIFLALVILLLFRTSWLKIRFLVDIYEFLSYRPFGTKKSTRQWQKIVSRLEKGLESEYKLAVIEADSMLEEALEKMRVTGESLEERLKKIPPDIISNISEVELAHQVRNNIVHDPDYRLSYNEAKKTLDVFEKVLTDLEVL